ncbi:glycosyl transferase [Vibrio inusitatus NBRC 102082]|uniref:Glycosyl transferase n=1 Tax=Vibrio inusitatus NBRC 102082 TaxID=1219070 RepID=A0A4Y3HU94_9VIBR|nr:glycosyltransferase [Vibrio inusitatus]GEA50330.1 glycosyl transferase [Vibrio inusitatus NBRC 102082]
MKPNHCIIFDPIPYHGGSKVATELAIKQVDELTVFHVLSASPISWRQSNKVKVTALPIPKGLAIQTQGLGYWTKQIYLTLCFILFTVCIMITRMKKPSTLLMASGPGVDFSGYMVSKLFSVALLQLIHGPVGKSSSSKWCLSQGHPTFYLASAKPSLLLCMETDELPTSFKEFTNGLDENDYPSTHRFSSNDTTVNFYWAASLLKWKGLDTLKQAIEIAVTNSQYTTNICYIKPKNSQADQSTVDKHLPNTLWHKEPKNLDEVRVKSDAYISTSVNEPFGLSTLEALAAGLIVIIPRDNAFWDKKLQHNVNCLKYTANDAQSLSQTMTRIANNLDQYQKIAKQGQKIATQYLASNTYREIAHAIEGNNEKETSLKQCSQIKPGEQQ